MIYVTVLSGFIAAIFTPTFIVGAPSYSNYVDETMILAFLAVYYLVVLGFSLIYYVVYALFLMKLFAKAHVPAWKAWVPFVNNWKFMELGGYQGAISLLFLAAFIPCVGWIASLVCYVYSCMAAYQISLKNGKDGAWVVLFIFLPIVWVGILGLGKSLWNENLGKPAYGPERPPAWPLYGYGAGMPTSGSYYGNGYNNQP